MTTIIRVISTALLFVGLFFVNPACAGFCDPLPSAESPTELITSEAQLRDRAYNAPSGTTLLIGPGVYYMSNFLHINPDNITLRGSTGNRDDVVLDFGGMTSGYFGVYVDGDDITIADLTIRNTTDHGVSINGNDRIMLYNLHIIDSNDQLVKVNPAGDGSDDGELACSLLEYTTSAPNTYTNGISAHDAHGWTVRDNTWRRVRTSSDSVPVQTILFWSGSTDTVVERNLLVDCSRGIAFGDSSHGSGDHVGGTVRNNIIYSTLPHDTAIEMVHATGWEVSNNTVLLMNPLSGLTWGIEARFSDTSGVFYNNLTTMNIWNNRDGALGTADPSNNLTNAELDWFVDPSNLDFRLTTRAQEAIDNGSGSANVSIDYHGDIRDEKIDIGADEWLPRLEDIIETLQMLAGSEASLSELLKDIDASGRIGLAEAIFLMEKLSPATE